MAATVLSTKSLLPLDRTRCPPGRSVGRTSVFRLIEDPSVPEIELQEKFGAAGPGISAGNPLAPKGFHGAGHEGRTRDIYLGKVALYH